jgi:chromosome segregation protein
MRIRKLELHGFKSFPDRTTLHFGSGIAVIVGPNGCGKSNIVDAIKWCIGEQSAKSLRGDDMLDVIFGGSTDRAKVGFAEVSLTFSAEGGEPLPGEYARFTEVSVGRRLHRDGTSEYMVQGAKARRKDIVDLFLDTGVGNNMYSFIEQGRIGEIVHASPEKRRLLLDEAAGISRYKSRRDEAQQRLEDTAGQLDRAADVTDEMARRLSILEGQVLRAARFRRARGVIRQLEIYLALARYSDQLDARRAEQAETARAREDLEAVERDITRREQDLAQRQAEVEVLEQGVVTWRDEVAELDAAVREREGERGFCERNRAEIEVEVVRHTAQLSEAEAEHAAAAAESASQTAAGEGVSRDITSTESRLLEVRAQHQGSMERRQQARDGAARSEREATVSVGESATLAARHDELAKRLAALPASRDRLSGSLDAARKEHSALAEKTEKARFSQASRRRALEVAKDLVSSAERDAAVGAAEEASSRGQVDKTEAEAQQQRKASESEIQRAVDAVGRAEKRARDGVADAERRATERVRAAQASTEAELESLVEEGRRSFRGAEQRAAAWSAAATVAESDRVQAEIAAIEQIDTALDVAGAAAALEEERRIAAELAATELAAQEEAQRRIVVATAARDQAQKEVDIVQRQLTDVEQRHDGLRRERDELVGRRRGLTAQAAAERDGERGAVAVRAALPAAVPLVERRPITEDETWLARAMGSRFLVPATDSVADLRVAAAAAKTAGPATVLLLGDGDPLAQLAASVRVVETLDQAITTHREVGGAVVVRSSGERIDADGWVHLGASGVVAEAAVRRRRELTSLEATLSVVEASFAAADKERVDTQGARGRAREALIAAEARLRSEEAAARQAAKLAVEAARTTSRTSTELVRAKRLRDEAARRSAREPRIMALRRRLADRLEAVAAAPRRALAEIREALDGAVEQARAGSAGVIEAARVDAAAAVVESRRGGDADVQAARGVVEALRASAARDEESRRERIGAARRDLDGVRARRQELDGVVSRVRSEQFAADVALARADGDLGSLAATDERLRSRITELESQLSQVIREGDSLAASMAAMETTRAEHGVRHAAIESRRQASLGARAQAERDEEALRSVVSELDVSLARLRERAKACGSAAERAASVASEAIARAARLRLRLDEFADSRTQTFENETRLRAEIAGLADRRASAAERLQRDRDRSAAMRKQIRELEIALRERLARREALTREAADAEARLSTVIADIEAIRKRIDERYQVSLAGALDRLDAMRALVLEPDPTIREPVEVGGHRVDGVDSLTIRPEALTDANRIASAVEQLDALREELSSIGDVNLAAFEEYRDLASRYQDLAVQRADLEASVESIRGAIAKMNRMCRERFREAFDRVNENFQRAYPRLVGGGSARLSLTDEEDLLETGVDIFVQPPGKRLQNLTLLSGGEKAMAAIALLLSLFQVKPSPFCLLDEVDAPLDEANGARFNDMLKEMSGVTQFIVITHNRKTMEVADTLYGITMPTPGVSRLVSVRLSGHTS